MIFFSNLLLRSCGAALVPPSFANGGLDRMINFFKFGDYFERDTESFSFVSLVQYQFQLPRPYSKMACKATELDEP